MSASQWRIALAVEWLAYGVVGVWLAGRGWSAGEVVRLALLLFFGLRVLVVAAAYGFTLAFSTPAAPGARSGAPGFLRMALVEYLCLIVLFVVVQPFERIWLGPDRLRPATDRLPILLIHGYHCNRGAWLWLRPRLEGAGWQVATHNLEPALADIDDYADGIARRVDEVLTATGAPRLILVGHSMGGLAARAYLRRHGRNRVERLITLASPHHGTRLAVIAWGRNGRQMRFGDPWLSALAEEQLPPGSVSIYSVHDNQVMPQREGSELAGARNVPLAGISHLGILFSPLALRALLDALPRAVRSECPASSG